MASDRLVVTVTVTPWRMLVVTWLVGTARVLDRLRARWLALRLARAACALVVSGVKVR